MISWYLSAQVRELLIQIPANEKDGLVRDLGCFPDGALPESTNPSWVIHFNDQCQLRGVDEEVITDYLKSCGYAVNQPKPEPPSVAVPRLPGVGDLEAEHCPCEDLLQQLLAKVDSIAASQQKMADGLRRELAETRTSIVAEVITVQSSLAARTKTWDAFYCYNSDDDPFVEKLYDQLSQRGVLGWRDRSRLVGGDNFADSISAVIKATGAALVCLGPCGLGPFQRDEVRAILYSDRIRAIPCLLPGFQKPEPSDLSEEASLVRVMLSSHYVDLDEFPDYLGRVEVANEETAVEQMDLFLAPLITAIKKPAQPQQ